VINELSEEATEFGRHALEALRSAGGDDLAQLAEREPTRRGSLVEPVLDELGSFDLNPRSGDDEAEAAAALCRVAGYWALGYPVAERLGRPADLDGDGLLVVNPLGPAARVGGMTKRWIAVDLAGHRSVARAQSGSTDPRKDAFVVGLDLEDIDDGGSLDAAVGLVLSCWTLLGMMDRAVELTRGYVHERRQFGQPLASFQGVQFQLTDAEVERVGLEESAKYALWSIERRQRAILADALALRLAALRAAEVVFRVAHQLHGAIGFCDETPLSWLSRASVPLRRLPFGLSATRAELTRHLGRRGLDGLFEVGPDALTSR